MNRIERRPKPRGKNNSANCVNSVQGPALVAPLLRWFGKSARDLPWRRTLDPYAVWVSEIMLQQTQVKTVIPYFERWMRELPTAESLANASSEKIHKLWEGLGYYTRVRNMQKAARMVVEQHGGVFPREFDAVLALPGVGRYTAGAISSIAFNQPAPILDGNVIRVLTRVFGIRENPKQKKTNAQLWQLATELVKTAMGVSLARQRGEGLRVRGGAGQRLLKDRGILFTPTPHPGPLPVEGRGRSVAQSFGISETMQLSGSCSALNQSLMELGATVCTPKAPRCGDCPLRCQCVARREDLIEQLPNLGERAVATARRFVACIVERRCAILVRQRPAGGVNAHFWEFPNVEVSLRCSLRKVRKQLETELGCELRKLTPLLTVRHTITRYRITLDVFVGTLNGDGPNSHAGQWLPIAKARELSFTSAHRRILRRISSAA